MKIDIKNLELVEVSVDKDTFFEGDPFNSEDEYMIVKDGDNEMSIGFDIDVDFDVETESGDGYLTPSFDDIENVIITFDVKDFDVNEEDVELTPELYITLEKILAKFLDN